MSNRRKIKSKAKYRRAIRKKERVTVSVSGCNGWIDYGHLPKSRIEEILEKYDQC